MVDGMTTAIHAENVSYVSVVATNILSVSCLHSKFLSVALNFDPDTPERGMVSITTGMGGPVFFKRF